MAQHDQPTGHIRGHHGSHGPHEADSGDPITPGQSQVAEAEGHPSDGGVTGYHRVTQRMGARLSLAAIAVPVALVIATLVAMVIFRP